MPIEKAVTVPGRGTVIVGTVQQGTLHKGADVEMVGYGTQVKSGVADIQVKEHL